MFVGLVISVLQDQKIPVKSYGYLYNFARQICNLDNFLRQFVNENKSVVLVVPRTGGEKEKRGGGRIGKHEKRAYERNVFCSCKIAFC